MTRDHLYLIGAVLAYFIGAAIMALMFQVV